MTHIMPPLDKTVFKPLKASWNKILINSNRENPGTLLPNKQFSKFIRELWGTAFRFDLIISGFRSTGTFPVDHMEFPEHAHDHMKFPGDAYDPIKLERFKNSKSSLVSIVDSQQGIPAQVNSPPLAN